MKQQPLSVYALFHSKNPEGQKIYTELYSLLCRYINNPFMDGLDIPVFYASGVDNINAMRGVKKPEESLPCFH